VMWHEMAGLRSCISAGLGTLWLTFFVVQTRLLFILKMQADEYLGMGFDVIDISRYLPNLA